MTPKRFSDAEIGVLQALVAEGTTLVARTRGGGPACRVRLCHLDPEHGFLLVNACDGQFAAQAMPPGAAVDFEALFGEWRIAFTATDAQAAAHAGQPAVRLSFPGSVFSGRRREHARTSIASSAALRLVAYSGAAPVFVATVTDVSRGGLGLQVGLDGASLHPGMVLAGCRLEREDGAAGVVEIEVRHTASVRLADGQQGWRAGVRFVSLSPEATRLIEALVG